MSWLVREITQTPAIRIKIMELSIDRNGLIIECGGILRKLVAHRAERERNPARQDKVSIGVRLAAD
jgi:hypothetical protein